MFANFIYLIALAAVSPLVLYRMVRHGRYRRGLGEKLFGLSLRRAREIRGDAASGGDVVWMHAVSVGEVNLLPGLIERLRQHHPDVSVAISTSTDSGYDLAVKHFGAEQVFFCPLDFTWAVNRTMRHLQPTQLVLAELELWPNLIRLADARMSCQPGQRAVERGQCSRLPAFSLADQTNFRQTLVGRLPG